MQLQLSLNVADRLHETLLVRGEPLDAVEAARLLIASPEAPAALCREILSTLVAHDRRFCWGSGPAPQLSLRQWEAPDPHLADVSFVALDLETTGARAGIAKITEVGAVRIEGLREVGHFSTLVNPLRPIPPMITHLTGITQEMVVGAPRIEEVIPELLQFLEGAVVIAHNASFDVGFLNYELQRLKGRRLGEERSIPYRSPGHWHRAFLTTGSTPSPKLWTPRSPPAIVLSPMRKRWHTCS